MLTYRQKLIQMADRSELGWRVVHEYESNPLAEDSEDEKKIYKAEARANRKLKAEKAKRAKTSRAWPYKRGGSSHTTSVQSNSVPTQKPGLCFHCGKPGHWRKECPGNTSNNKISISKGIFSNICLESCDKQVVCESEQGPVSEIKSSVCVDTSNSLHIALSPSQMKCSLKEKSAESPVGRLKRYLNKWRSVSASSYIVDVVENGYRLPFKQTPPSVCLRNNKSARDNPGFVTTEIENLLKKGVISVTEKMPVVVNPLTVAYNKAGKPRLVLDCRHVNQYIHVFKVKFEDLKVALGLFGSGTYVFTYDLKSAYHHIDISEMHKSYLGFSWNYNGENTYFIFNSLPFGLSSAGHIFTKTVRVVVAYLRSFGHKIVMYLDDGIGGDSNYDKAFQSSKFVRETFSEFGFLIAEDKCSWVPCKIGTWLGYVLDYEQGRIFASAERITMLEKAIESVMYQVCCDKYKLVHVRTLASLIGRIISLQSVLGNIVRLRTREMYNCILARASWDAPVLITETAMAEIIFWKHNVRLMNNKGKGLDQTITCDAQVFSDASAFGYGGYMELFCATDNVCSFTEKCKGMVTGVISPEVDTCMRCPQRQRLCISAEVDCDPPEAGILSAEGIFMPAEEGLRLNLEPEKLTGLVCLENMNKRGKACTPIKNEGKVVGSWLDVEKHRSSSWREAEALNRVLKSYGDVLKRKSVKLLSDNKNVKSILLNGSKRGDLQGIALQVNEFCMKNDICIYPEWIPRDQNQLADHLSRSHDCDDWSKSKYWFYYLDSIWGTHTVDRFSTHYNNHCRRFNSKWWVPGSEGINAFNQSWINDNNWLVPPPNRIIECINKIEQERARCTLVVPKWKSGAFWPRLVDSKGNFNSYVKDFKVLPKVGLICVGKGHNGVFSKSPLPFHMMALKVMFSKS